MSRSTQLQYDSEYVFKVTNNGLDVFLREGLGINEQFSNPLRKDKTPSAKLVQSKISDLWNMVDYSRNKSWNCIQFIQEKYNLNYVEAIKRCLDKIDIKKVKEPKKYKQSELIYEYSACKFTQEHKDYWGVLTEKFLNFHKIYATNLLAINKKICKIPDNILCFVYEPEDLPYGKLKILKIGVPKEDKWRNNLPIDYIYYTSDINDGDKIFLAKSNKDALINRLIGIKSPAVLSENFTIISKNILDLEKRFPNSEIILNLGSDPQAIDTTIELQELHRCRSFTVPPDDKINDNFEWVKKYGLKSYKELIKDFKRQKI